MTEINEFQAPKGAQRYYMQAQAHDQAATKYKLSVKTADPEQAKNHRAIGKLHGVISAALNKIAAKHTGLEYSQGLEKKAALMAKKNVTEGNDMADDINEDVYTVEEALEDLVFSAIEQRPGDFAATFGEMIRSRALERIEDIKVQVAQDTFADDVQEEVEQVDELHGKGKIGDIVKGHKIEGGKHDSNSNAGDYHAAQVERGSWLQDRVRFSREAKIAKSHSDDHRSYAKSRKKVMDKEGKGAQAREID